MTVHYSSNMSLVVSVWWAQMVSNQNLGEELYLLLPAMNISTQVWRTTDVCGKNSRPHEPMPQQGTEQILWFSPTHMEIVKQVCGSIFTIETCL